MTAGSERALLPAPDRFDGVGVIERVPVFIGVVLDHRAMLTDPANHVLLQTKFAPLSKTTYIMTFHDEGIFPFYCTARQPAMSGQIIVTAR